MIRSQMDFPKKEWEFSSILTRFKDSIDAIVADEYGLDLFLMMSLFF